MRYKCPLCGEVFTSVNGLAWHFRCRHVHGDECPCCGARARSLASHALAWAFRDACHAVLYLAVVHSTGKNRSIRRLVASIISGGHGGAPSLLHHRCPTSRDGRATVHNRG